MSAKRVEREPTETMLEAGGVVCDEENLSPGLRPWIGPSTQYGADEALRVWRSMFDAAPDADAGRELRSRDGYSCGCKYECDDTRLETCGYHAGQERAMAAITAEIPAALLLAHRGNTAAAVRALRERAARLQDALTWMIPMAKGWARDYPVGRNAEIVGEAEAILRGAPDA